MNTGSFVQHCQGKQKRPIVVPQCENVHNLLTNTQTDVKITHRPKKEPLCQILLTKFNRPRTSACLYTNRH
jgi:hypothetical protein